MIFCCECKKLIDTAFVPSVCSGYYCVDCIKQFNKDYSFDGKILRADNDKAIKYDYESLCKDVQDIKNSKSNKPFFTILGGTRYKVEK